MGLRNEVSIVFCLFGLLFEFMNLWNGVLMGYLVRVILIVVAVELKSFRKYLNAFKLVVNMFCIMVLMLLIIVLFWLKKYVSGERYGIYLCVMLSLSYSIW